MIKTSFGRIDAVVKSAAFHSLLNYKLALIEMQEHSFVCCEMNPHTIPSNFRKKILFNDDTKTELWQKRWKKVQ